MEYVSPLLIGLAIAYLGLRILLPAARGSDFYLEQKWRRWSMPGPDEITLIAGVLYVLSRTIGVRGLRLLVALVGLTIILLGTTVVVLGIVSICGGL